MRIPSGVTDQYIYFVAVDATDFVTRETGLSSFTVYRSRNGAAAAAMTTPTVNETDATNMPGVYELLCDEDMTIGSGNDSEEMVFHITATGMAPVTRTIELYRAKITAGNTLSVESDGDLTKVNTLDGHTAQTGDNYARLGAPAGASVSADIAAIEAQTDEIGAAGAGLTAVPWNSAWDAEVQSEVTDALAAYNVVATTDLPTNFSDLAITATTGRVTAGTVLDKTGYSISGTITTLDGLENISAADVNTQCDASIETYRLDELMTTALGSQPTVGSMFGDLTEDDGGTQRFTVNALENAPSGGGGGVADWTAGEREEIRHRLGITGTTSAPGGTPSLSTQASVDTIDGNVDAILLDTAEIGAAGAGLTAVPWNSAWDAEVQSEVTDALVAYNVVATTDLPTNFIDLAITATSGRVTAGTVLDKTGYSISGTLNTLDDLTIPTATQNADALLNRDMSAVTDSNSRSPLNALRFLRNNWSVAATTLTVTKEDDSTTAWTADVTSDANAEPITGVDPA